MKKVIITILMSFLFLNISTSFSQRIGMGNPAAEYVTFLGYKYEVRKTIYGEEYDVSIFPDGSECDDWNFFRGICGQKYSYCTLKGCSTKTKIEDKGAYTIQYAVCYCKDSLGIINEIHLDDFMMQHGDTLNSIKQIYAGENK